MAGFAILENTGALVGVVTNKILACLNLLVKRPAKAKRQEGGAYAIRPYETGRLIFLITNQ